MSKRVGGESDLRIVGAIDALYFSHILPVDFELFGVLEDEHDEGELGFVEHVGCLCVHCQIEKSGLRTCISVRVRK
jgi:hypothetical protein